MFLIKHIDNIGQKYSLDKTYRQARTEV